MMRRSPHSHSSAGCKSCPYTYLLKHNIARMSKVLFRAQSYIQLEEAMKATSNHSAKLSDGGRKSKSTYETPGHAQDLHWGQPPYKKQVLLILPPNPLRSYKSMERFTPLRLPINEVFNIFINQPWVRRPKPIQQNPPLLGSEEYCSYHKYKGHQTIYC